MIKFKRLAWKNFLSTGNVFTEIDLCGKDTTLIVGTNGAGKSTILDALTFGLFGKPFRKITKPQLVNSITQKNCEVELEFSVGTNNYKIIRGIKPNKFEVYQNGELLNQSAEMKDYQELLEKQIIKINQKSFSQVVVLGSATFQPFMQLAGGARREIIEDLLDLQIFTTMNNILKDKIMFNNDKIIDTNHEKKLIQSKIDMSAEHLKKIQQNSEKMIAEKKELIKETEGHIAELQEKYTFLTDQINTIELMSEDKEAVKKRSSKLTGIYHQVDAKINLLNENNHFFDDTDECPTCKQGISEDHKHHVKAQNEEKLTTLKEGLESIKAEQKATEDKLNELLKKVEEQNRIKLKAVEIGTNIESLKNYLGQLNKDIANIGTDMEDDDASKSLAYYDEKLKELEVKYNELSEDKNVLGAASVLLKDTGIKSRIIKQYIPVINKLINKYLSAMDFFVSFELDESFNETIKSRYRDDFTYASFSEGEKQKIDLALLFTWRAVAKLRNSISTNLLIMDEVFDSSLDQNATDYLMNIIRDIAKDSNIFIISHKEHMNEKFSNVLKFIKHKNFSQIQE
jgi:DNA repair exonuclease SbcCD ATPase subunit